MRHKSGNGGSVKLEQFLDDIQAIVRDGEELLKESAGGVRDKALAGAKTTDRVIRSHPYETLAIVFSLGFLAGLLAVGTVSRETREG